jgi:hypothetical protein
MKPLYRSSSSNTGAIVGGVVGALAFLACLGILFFFYRRSQRKKSKVHARPNLFTGDEDEPEMSGPNIADGRQSAVSRRNELPEYYQPEPFNVPDPLQTTHTEDDGRTSEGRPLSGYTSTSRSGTPDLLGFGLGSAGVGGNSSSAGTSSVGRKGQMRNMRPVNVIQHDDAGPSENAPLTEEEPDTVELPPAYTNIRK